MSHPPGPTSPDPQQPVTATPPPQYPGPAATPPQYPGTATPSPTYPGTTAPPPPQYPGTTAPPPPQYPGTTAPPPPQYPGTTAPPPTYPGATAPPPQYPGATTPQTPYLPPQYPNPAAQQPGYPTTPQPGHPGAYPNPAVPQPSYGHPGTHPQYPGTPTPQHQAPAHSWPGHPPQHAFGSQPPAPDNLHYRHLGSRVHVAAHQRGADATAIGQLATQVPGFLVSLAVVAAISVAMFGSTAGWIMILAWLASGALIFHRPTELAFARHVLKLRRPLAEERARLEPIWREVTARAGVEADTYELMIENSTDLNAMAAAGHVVGVTTYALNRIPSSNLAAVLAHELGHHTGGHAWAGLLGYWYSLPGRIAWAVTRGLARAALAVARVFSFAGAGLMYLFMGAFVVIGFITAWYITIPLVLAPYLLAAAGRRGELRADQHSAALGFAPEMAQVLHHFQAEQDAVKAYAAAQGKKLREPGGLAKLLSSHPDNYTRLRALEPYLQPIR
ncbi:MULTISPECIES: M48 family metalloprotease [unclassified Streptomyces]|uniref:M48 family metalloprotease n=1 Tax=unclassified Streptomyces TaxID=2593676 RepID=UPI0036E31CAD